MKPVLISVAAAALVLAGCQTTPSEPLRATAQLQPTKGNKTFGEATFEEVDGKVRIIVFVQGLKANAEHALHVHEKGDCSSGDGMSAGGHFNPHNKPHGHPSSAERHAGDLPSLNSNKAGRGNIKVDVDQLTIAPGPASIIGRGIIVHADPDDWKSQPAGNAGPRIACGIIRAG